MSDTRRKILSSLQGGHGFLAGLAAVSEDGAPRVRHATGTTDDDPNFNAPYFQIEGKAEVSTDIEEKRADWHDDLAYSSQAPENPDGCVLKVHPFRITLHSMTSMDTVAWTK